MSPAGHEPYASCQAAPCRQPSLAVGNRRLALFGAHFVYDLHDGVNFEKSSSPLGPTRM